MHSAPISNPHVLEVAIAIRTNWVVVTERMSDYCSGAESYGPIRLTSGLNIQVVCLQRSDAMHSSEVLRWPARSNRWSSVQVPLCTDSVHMVTCQMA